MKQINRWALFVLGFFLVAAGATQPADAKPVALFYLGSNPDSVRSFLAHYKQIDLLVPTWYDLDEDGMVTGEPDPTVLEIAHKDKLPVMPIVAFFNKKGFHAFAGNQAAWPRMTDALIREAKLNGYSGFQFDFENVSYLDRDALTAIVKFSADALHEAGFQLSIATVPNYPGHPAGKGSFAKWIYTDWRGAYDIAELAKSVDLLCLMTYDQNTRWTMPGPVAGWQWTVDNLDYALKVVPKEKLSLGIPLYGYHWYTGGPTIDKTTGEEKPNQQADYINTIDVNQLAIAYKAKVE
jgi:spore germination protein YaaH